MIFCISFRDDKKAFFLLVDMVNYIAILRNKE